MCSEQEVIVVSDALAERGKGWVCSPPTLLFEALEEPSSPYINQFLSADTVVPGYANPQNLNRYSYVTNNPLRYTDPTGHYCVDEDANGNTVRVDCASWEPVDSGGGNGEGGNDEDDDEDDGGLMDYCSLYPEGCGPALTPAPTILEPTPAEGGANQYLCFTHPSSCGIGTPIPLSSPGVATNLPIEALITVGVLLTGAIVVSEVGLVWAEINFAPLVGANPMVGVPLELILVSTSLTLMDLEVAYWAYTYRVLKNPDVKQDFEILPPWGL